MATTNLASTLGLTNASGTRSLNSPEPSERDIDGNEVSHGTVEVNATVPAWIVEKFRTWSDCDGHPENVFTRDQLLTNVTTYWVTQTITSSARLYWEHMHSRERPEYVSVPTGVARYPKEILRYPRSWVERRYNVTYWADMPRGGHFAAMEQPALFAADLRRFSRTLE